MRVLVAIFEQLVPISGGGTPRINSIINILVKKGHQVTVTAPLATDVEEKYSWDKLVTQFVSIYEDMLEF